MSGFAKREMRNAKCDKPVVAKGLRTVWDGPAFFYPCGKPTGCKPNPYFANGTVFANRTVRMTKSGAVGNISAFNASSGDCTLISFGETERWGRAPWVTSKDYTHPDLCPPSSSM